MGVCGVFSGNGNTLPERGYSPSILEGELGPLRQGVPEQKQSPTRVSASIYRDV